MISCSVSTRRKRTGSVSPPRWTLASDVAGGGAISPHVHCPITLATIIEPTTAPPSTRMKRGVGGVGKKSTGDDRATQTSRSSKQAGCHISMTPSAVTNGRPSCNATAPLHRGHMPATMESRYRKTPVRCVVEDDIPSVRRGLHDDLV